MTGKSRQVLRLLASSAGERSASGCSCGAGRPFVAAPRPLTHSPRKFHAAPRPREHHTENIRPRFSGTSTSTTARRHVFGRLTRSRYFRASRATHDSQGNHSSSVLPTMAQPEWTGQKVRDTFFQFFEQKGHKIGTKAASEAANRGVWRLKSSGQTDSVSHSAFKLSRTS
jgi:hypothetical protein